MGKGPPHAGESPSGNLGFILERLGEEMASSGEPSGSWNQSSGWKSRDIRMSSWCDIGVDWPWGQESFTAARVVPYEMVRLESPSLESTLHDC